GFSGSYFLLLNAKTAEQKQKITFFSTLLLFIVYIIIILDFTLIDDSFGRNISNYFSLNYSQKAKFLEQNTNFIPFKTVKIFINGYNSGKLSLLAICENLIGNLIVFMPYAYFLPRLFHTTKKTVPFLVAVLLSVMVIEILQILFLTGSADIDDLILNTAGAMGIFGLMKTKGYYK
ncbi:MAG: VanZ family protein, partial [Clostridia bacterium]|nr:VanZ family protein [Clostridia bacterium]